MTENAVWVSDILWDISVTYGFEWEQIEKDRNSFIELSRKSMTGAALSSEEFPEVLWSTSKRQDRKKIKNIFRANGLFVVSSQFADVLRKYDLGGTSMYPVTLLKSNRQDQFDGDYFFLNLCEKKVGFDPENSRNFRKPTDVLKGKKGSMPLILDHEDIAVTSNVLEGVDLWVDHTLFKSMFFKGALAEEIIAKKLIPKNGTESKSVARCKVIDAA